jgi:hypothetical protein
VLSAHGSTAGSSTRARGLKASTPHLKRAWGLGIVSVSVWFSRYPTNTNPLSLSLPILLPISSIFSPPNTNCIPRFGPSFPSVYSSYFPPCPHIGIAMICLIHPCAVLLGQRCVQTAVISSCLAPFFSCFCYSGRDALLGRIVDRQRFLPICQSPPSVCLSLSTLAEKGRR